MRILVSAILTGTRRWGLGSTSDDTVTKRDLREIPAWSSKLRVGRNGQACGDESQAKAYCSHLTAVWLRCVQVKYGNAKNSSLLGSFQLQPSSTTHERGDHLLVHVFFLGLPCRHKSFDCLLDAMFQKRTLVTSCASSRASRPTFNSLQLRLSQPVHVSMSNMAYAWSSMG